MRPEIIPILAAGTAFFTVLVLLAWGREKSGQSDETDSMRFPRLSGAITKPADVIRWIARRGIGTTVWARTRVRRWFADLFNPSSAYSSQLVGLAFIVILGITGISALAFLYTGVSIEEGSAGPFLRTAIGIATNLWVWVAVLLFFGRGVLFFSDRYRARKTATETGYSYQSVRRLAEEVKKPDMEVCERVLLQSDDDRDDAIGWTLDALDGNGHNSISIVTGEEAEEVATDGGQPPEETDDEQAAGDEDEDDELPLWANLRLMRKDIASAFDIERVLWRFGTPFLVIFVAELIVARIWVSAAGYALMTGVALIGALGYYLVTDYRHRRRLAALRDDDERTPWNDCSMLVKTVDIPEETWYIAFTAGKVYASTEKEELAETAVDRAFDRLEGRHPAPAIEERNAWCLERYIVNTDAWREEAERPLVMDELVDAVANADEGLIPKRLLADRVIEGDRGYALLGVIHIGLGRDPELVADVYEDLVEEFALVEYEVEIEDGETMSAVTLGDDAQQPRLVQLRAEFSSLFRAARDARYELPEPDLPTSPEPFVEPTAGD